MIVCMVFSITGRVQGVSFRAATRHQARTLGLTGYAINCANGSVEVLACGEKDTIERLHAWLWQGPPQARVSDVQARPSECKPPAGFVIG